MKKCIIFLLLGAFFTGCSTTIHQQQPSSALNVPAVAGRDLKADIAVDIRKKLSGAATKVKIFGITTQEPKYYSDGVTFAGSSNGGFLSSLFGGSSDDVKAAAAYQAMKKSGADVLVAPQYIISKESFFFFYSKVSVKVTGYPGVIRKIE